MQHRVHTLFQRLLHIFFRMTRGLTLGVRAVIRNENGEFLLVRHTYTPGWHFPGGGVEKGETVLQALRKEVEQETGLKIVGKPRLHGIFHNSHVSSNDHVAVFLCAIDAPELARVRSAEISKIQYFSMEHLPADIDPGTKIRMREIANCDSVNEHWIAQEGR